MTRARHSPPSQPGVADQVRARVGRMPLVGRGAERAAIEARLAATRHGAPPAAMLLVGEAGIGKSRLLAEACAGMTAAGGQVLLGRCLDERGMPPFSPWIDALTTATPTAAELAPIHAALAGTGAMGRARAGHLTPEQRKLHLFAGVTRALERLGTRGSLLIGFDDLQWSDAASNELLRYVMIHAGAAPLLVVGTCREEEAMANAGLTRTREELHRRRLLTTIRVGPLAAAETERHVAALLGREDPTLAAAIHDHGAGNPFFVEEVVRALADDGLLDDAEADAARPPRRLPVPESVVAVIGRRWDRASAACRATLELAALAGHRIAVDLLAGAGQRTAAEVVTHLEEATRLALVRPLVSDEAGTAGRDDGADFVFLHDRVREVIAARLNPVRRRDLHARLGDALEAAAGHDQDMSRLAALVHHFRLARQPERAAAYAERLGDAAMRAHAHVEAARAYRAAVDLAPAMSATGAGRVSAAPDLLLKAGDAALAAGDAGGAIDAYASAERHFAAASAASPRAGALRRLGMAYARREEFDLAVAYLEAAGAALRERDPPVMAADSELPEILVELGTIQGTSLARYDEAIANGRRGLDLAITVAGEAPVREAQARLALAKTLMRSGDLAAGQACLAPALPLALRAGELGLAAEIAGATANYHYWLGNLDASARAARKRRDLGRQAGDPYVLRHATSWLANLALARGDWPAAERLLAEAEPQIDRIESPEPYAFLHQVAGLLQLSRGAYAEAITRLEAAVAAFRESGPATVIWYLGCLAHAYLMGGDQPAMRRLTDELDHLIAALPPSALPRAPALAQLGIIAVRTEDQAMASRYYEALAGFAHQHHWVLIDRVLGMLAALLSDGTAAERHFEDATRIADRGGVRPELALSLAERGLALRRAGTPESAVAAERFHGEAIERLTRLGMTGEAARLAATASDHPAGQPRSFPAGLTAREAEVLVLVCHGLTNRAIGHRLSITEKTVTNHLTHIFTKAGVENRSAAVAFALRHGLA